MSSDLGTWSAGMTRSAVSRGLIRALSFSAEHTELTVACAWLARQGLAGTPEFEALRNRARRAKILALGISRATAIRIGMRDWVPER